MSDAAALGDTWESFATAAHKHDASPQQVCLAWELPLSEAVIPIPGASRPESVRSSVAAVGLVLDEEDLAALR
jgi:aryl-alcohol dehydrogenase-like predicted oxidoreductase